MSKSGSLRVKDYCIGKAHVDYYVPFETKKRFVDLANLLSQFELCEKLVAVGETTPLQVKKRVTEKESEALLRLNECNGDYDVAIHRVAEGCRVINPKSVYNPRLGETPEETALRNRLEGYGISCAIGRRMAHNPDSQNLKSARIFSPSRTRSTTGPRAGGGLWSANALEFLI